MPKESQVERCEYQDDANIRYQPFPESVSEEREICADDEGCHRHHVKRNTYLSAHFRHLPTSVYSPVQPDDRDSPELPADGRRQIEIALIDLC
jgi:hypothetical protein